MKDQNCKNLRPERPLVSCAILIFDQPALLSGHLIHYFPLHEQGGAGCIVVRKRLYLDADDHQSSKAAPFLASRKLCKIFWLITCQLDLMLLTLFDEKEAYTRKKHNSTCQESWKQWTRIGSRLLSWATTFTRSGWGHDLKLRTVRIRQHKVRKSEHSQTALGTGVYLLRRV